MQSAPICDLEDENLGPIAPSDSPGDGILISDGDDLSTVNVSRDQRAGEFALNARAGAGTGLPGCSAIGIDIDCAEILVSQIARGPALGISLSGSERREYLRFAGAGDVARVVSAQVEDELALIAAVLLIELECDQGGDVLSVVAVSARDEAAAGVEIDGAGGGGVLRGEVGEDGGDGLTLAAVAWGVVW